MKALSRGVLVVGMLATGVALAEEPAAPEPTAAPVAAEPAPAPAPVPVQSAPVTKAAPGEAPAAAEPAQTPSRQTPFVRVHEPEYLHKLDIGGAFGINSAGGFGPFSGYGLKADLRLFPLFSVGGTVGWGLWGPRLTPHARIYPAGISRGVFLELGLTWNAGGETAYCQDPSDRWAFGSCDEADKVEVDMEPVRTANAALGYRHDIAGKGWIAAELGWAYRLDHPEYTVTRGNLNDDEKDVLRFARPGGVLVGISGGFSAL